ncbi:MAG: hypothetical protein ABI813_13400 [Bacteroidota bacterium]
MKKIEDITVDIDRVQKLSGQMFSKEQWSVTENVQSIKRIGNHYQGAMQATKNNWVASSMSTAIQLVCDNAHDSGTVLIAFHFLSGKLDAQKMLFHYLFGKGEEVEVNTARVLDTDSKLKIFIYEGIWAALAKGRPSGSVHVQQFNYGNHNWHYAFGAVNIPWIKLGQRIELWIKDDYKWHPDEKRLDQCLHRAMTIAIPYGARHFDYHGSKMTISPEALYASLNKALPWKYR